LLTIESLVEELNTAENREINFGYPIPFF
jgi:hypothetical protein